MSLLFWLLGIQAILYHCFFHIILVILFICYKIYHKCKLQQYPSSWLVSDKDKNNIIMNNSSKKYNRSSWPSHAAALVLVLVSSNQVLCLEQDAQLLMPITSFVKSIIKTATLGAPLELNYGTSDLAKSLASLTWRTGFPVTIPEGFIGKTQDFYNRVRERVNRAEVKDIERKSFANLKTDLDKILDGIVEEVRESKDGLYTDYLHTRVDGIPLEDACFALGTQLKAYGIDLTNYKNIAGMVLRVPLMQKVASRMAKLAPSGIELVSDLTSNLSSSSMNQLPDVALNILSQLSNSAINFGADTKSHLPSSFSLFGSSHGSSTVQPVSA